MSRVEQRRVLLTTTEGSAEADARVYYDAFGEPERIYVDLDGVTKPRGWSLDATVATLRLAVLDGRIR